MTREQNQRRLLEEAEAYRRVASDLPKYSRDALRKIADDCETLALGRAV